MQATFRNIKLFHRWGLTFETLTNKEIALACVVQWIECGSENQMVAGSIPSQGTSLGCGPGQVPSRGRVRGNHTLMFLSLPPFPSLKVNK